MRHTTCEERESFLSQSLPAGRPVLSHDELRHVCSWSGLVEAYAGRGVEFGTKQEYLEQAASDWGVICSVLAAEARSRELPDIHPSTTVVAKEGEPIDIFAILHSPSVHPEVLALRRRTLDGNRTLLTEQNLGALYLDLHSDGLDLPDHFARGVFRAVGDFERGQVDAIRRLFRRRGSPQRSLRELFGEEFFASCTPQGKAIDIEQRKRRKNDEFISCYSRLCLFIPGDWWSSLPANVLLSYKHEEGIPYTMSEARSAYLAEFLRHWNVEQMLSNSSRRLPPEKIQAMPRRKQILCGHAHEQEIAAFLHQGSREEKVVARASRDARMVNEQGLDGLLAVHRSYQRRFALCEVPLTLAKGAALAYALGGALVGALR